MDNKLVKSLTLIATALMLIQPAFADTGLDKADNAFMMLCTALVIFMILPGIGLFYGGLLRSKNVLSLMVQVMAVSSLIYILWVIYGYSIAFGSNNSFFGNFDNFLLAGVKLKGDVNGFHEFVNVAFQGSFAALTVCLAIGSFAERIKFAAVLIFAVIWFSLSYLPIAHMVWADGGWLSNDGALDFAGGTVVHINAAMAGLVGAYFLGKRIGFGKENLRPHNLPTVFIGASVLYIGWFGFNAGSAGAANEIAALAFINTIVATSAAVLSWLVAESILHGKASLLGACSGCIAGLVAITPAAGTVGIAGSLVIGLVGGVVGLWGVVWLKRLLKVDDTCDVFGIHGVCGIVGCLLTGVFTSSSLGGVGYGEGVNMFSQLTIQAISVIVSLVWSAVVAFIAFKIAGALVGGLRVDEVHEREGLDLVSHGENAYN